jgi:endonuclease/exonuclease/phosphatase family metal-dependent hydrolase
MKNSQKNQFFVAIVLCISSTVWGAGWRVINFATFNIQGGKNIPQVYNIQNTANEILRTNADVIALQEIVVKWDPPCADNMADLKSRIGSTYPFSIFVPSETQPGDLFQCGWATARRRGNAIFSKLPIVQSWSLQLPTSWTPRSAAAVRIQKDGLDWIVYSTHLQNDSPGIVRSTDRLNQAATIANHMATLPSWFSYFVLADFNIGWNAPELAPLRQTLFHPDNADGIDFGFFRPFATGVQMTQQPVVASDHPAVSMSYLWYSYN